MNYSITGIVYLIFFIVLSYLLYRFLEYFKKDRTTVSKLFFLLTLPFWIFVLIRTISGLFFATNLDFLKFTFGAAAFLEAIGLAIGAYLISYLKFPNISPWFSFSLIFVLGLVATFFTINIPYQPFLEQDLTINWNLDVVPFPLLLLRLFIFMIIFIPLILFFKDLLKSEESALKSRAQKLILFFSFGLIVVILDFIILKFFRLGTIWRDISFIALSIILFFSLIKSKDFIK